MYLADMLTDLYASDSAVLRATAATTSGHARASLQVDSARVSSATPRTAWTRRTDALSAMTDGDTLRTMLAGLRPVPESRATLTRWRYAGGSRTMPLRRRIFSVNVRDVQRVSEISAISALIVALAPAAAQARRQGLRLRGWPGSGPTRTRCS